MRNFGNNRFGGRPRGRDRFDDRDSRRGSDMHDVTCDKCGIRCQVPFKPTGDKPVLCNDCFRKNNNSRNSSSQSSVSSEQLNQINKKLDKILLVLQDLELEVDEDAQGELYEDSDDEEESDDNFEDSEEELNEDSEDEQELDEESDELEGE